MAVVPVFLFRTGAVATCNVIDDLGNPVLDDLGNQVQAPCNVATAAAIPFFLFRTGSNATVSSTAHFLGVYVANNALTVTVF